MCIQSFFSQLLKNKKIEKQKQSQSSVSKIFFFALFSLTIATAQFVVLPFIAYAQSIVTIQTPTLLEPRESQEVTTAAPIFAGTSLNDTTVEIYIDNIFVGSTQTESHPSGVGNFYWTAPFSLTNGEHYVRVRAFYQVTGEGSDFSEYIKIKISAPESGAVTPPSTAISAPTIVFPQDGSKTIDDTPDIGGVSVNDTNIHVYVNDSFDGSSSLINDLSSVGHFTHTIQTPLQRGKYHTITAAAQTQDGMFSGPSEPVTILVEYPYIAPTLLWVKSKGNTAYPTVAGVAHNDSTISLYIDGVLDTIFTPENDPSGTLYFEVQPSKELAFGSHAITATAADKNGKVSQMSNTLSFTRSAYQPVQEPVQVQDEEQTEDGKGEPTAGTQEQQPTQEEGAETTEPSVEQPSEDGQVKVEDEEEGTIEAGEEEEQEQAEEEKILEEELSTQPNWPLIAGLIILIALAIIFIIWYLSQKRRLLNEGIDKLFSDTDEEDKGGSVDMSESVSTMPTGEEAQKVEKGAKKEEPAPQAKKSTPRIDESDITMSFDDDIPPPPPAI